MKTLLSLLLVSCTAFADDWPQWRGPQRNGVSKETGLLKEWPKEGPKLLWSATDLGNGYSSFAVVGDRLYTIGNEGMEKEFVQARNVSDGKQTWRAQIGKVGPNTQQADYGAARSTPTVVGQYFYALGSDGDLVSSSIADGKPRWQKNLRTDFAGKPGGWAYAESPLVDGDQLVCTPGGAENTIIALNRHTGALIWKTAIPEAGDAAAFSSVIIVEAAGVKQYVQLLEKGLVGIDAKTGKLLWHYKKPVSVYGANIPTPLGSDGYVYVASAGTGGGAIHLVSKDGKIEPEEVYFQSKLPTAIGGVIKVGNNLFGTTGAAMMGVDFATGKILWEDRALGAASMCFADGRLYLHSESGEVALVEAAADAYHEKGRFKQPAQAPRKNQMEKAWAYPVVANGRLYIRDHNMLWCYDVKAK